MDSQIQFFLFTCSVEMDLGPLNISLYQLALTFCPQRALEKRHQREGFCFLIPLCSNSRCLQPSTHNWFSSWLLQPTHLTLGPALRARLASPVPGCGDAQPPAAASPAPAALAVSQQCAFGEIPTCKQLSPAP